MREVSTLKKLIEEQINETPEKVSVIQLVDLFVEYAYSSHASDIHMEPEKEKLRIRYRIDGLLSDVLDKATISKELHQEIISRIKVLAGLRTDEHLLPQDGRLRVEIENFGNVDV